MSRPFAAALLITLVAGCASAPTTQLAQADKVRETGTVLPDSSHGRNVKFIGNQSFRTDTQIRSLGNEVGARSN